MQGISSETLPLPATPKGVTKWAFIYVKRVKAKTVSYRILGFLEYGMIADHVTRCVFFFRGTHKVRDDFQLSHFVG